MAQSAKKSPDHHVQPRQIVGISLTPEMAREVKAHAGKRGVSLKKLFEEMWQAYKKQAAGAKP